MPAGQFQPGRLANGSWTLHVSCPQTRVQRVFQVGLTTKTVKWTLCNARSMIPPLLTTQYTNAGYYPNAAGSVIKFAEAKTMRTHHEKIHIIIPQSRIVTLL
jgi:hypothetical protein